MAVEGDFSWLWRNEALSDFTLVIREVHSHPSAGAACNTAATEADEVEEGVQTRSGKRRRTTAPPANYPVHNTRSRSSQQQRTPPAAAGPSTRTHHQQGHALPDQEQLAGQQQEHAAAAAQQTAGRATRRTARQQLTQQQEQLQRPNQGDPAAGAPAAAAAAGPGDNPAPVGRRTRRNASSQQQGSSQPARAAAAAEGQAEDEDTAAGTGAAAAAAGSGHQRSAQQDAAAAGATAGAAPPSGRKTRSTRGKKRTAAAAAAAVPAADVTAGNANARTRAEQQQEQQQQQVQDPPQAQQGQRQQQQQQQRQSDAGGPPATRRSRRRQQVMQQLQQSMQQLTTGSDHGQPNQAADPGIAPPQQQEAAGAGPEGTISARLAAAAAAELGMALPAAAAAAAAGADVTAAVEIRVPVHAVVLAGFSEYFKALIFSWSGNLNRTLTLDVGLDEGNAALLMVEFMYTGKLPDASPEELLKMIRLADQYQVTRFMAAASSSFEALPLANITPGVMLQVFRLPQLMLDAPEMARVLAKARAKLLDLYGDLEKVWACETLREQFLSLPFSAVRCLLGSDATTVAAENTVLVALTGWVEEGTHGRSTTGAQRKELLSLVRLPYLTSSFIGDVLLSVNWIRDALDTRQLLNAFQFAISSETTRQRLASYDYGPSSVTPHFRCPRPTSTVTRASFEWSIELSTIKRMVADAKLWGRVVELSSPLHFFAGFWWQLLFNVEKTPTPADAPPDLAAAAAGTVVEFVGVRCHVNCGAHDTWPRVVRFKATIAALQTGFWDMDYAYSKAIEGPIVDGVGLGYPGFFALPGQALESEAAWSRFVRNGRVQLRCEVTDCE